MEITLCSGSLPTVSLTITILLLPMFGKFLKLLVPFSELTFTRTASTWSRSVDPNLALVLLWPAPTMLPILVPVLLLDCRTQPVSVTSPASTQTVVVATTTFAKPAASMRRMPIGLNAALRLVR